MEKFNDYLLEILNNELLLAEKLSYWDYASFEASFLASVEQKVLSMKNNNKYSYDKDKMQVWLRRSLSLHVNSTDKILKLSRGVYTNNLTVIDKVIKYKLEANKKNLDFFFEYFLPEKMHLFYTLGITDQIPFTEQYAYCWKDELFAWIEVDFELELLIKNKILKMFKENSIMLKEYSWIENQEKWKFKVIWETIREFKQFWNTMNKIDLLVDKLEKYTHKKKDMKLMKDKMTGYLKWKR